MSLVPKEHGAYGQISFPLIAAFAVAGPSRGGLFLAAAMLAAFLAHEPALVLLGLRGRRTKRELGGAAMRWLGCCVVAALAAGAAGLLSMPPSVRWSIAIPLVPATLLIVSALRGSEKSWYGETATALACAGATVPISMAAGVSFATSARVAIPFALLFVSSTLAVRVVILRVRRGGDPEATATTRRAALTLVVASGVLLVLAAGRGLLPPSILAATAPGLLTAAAIAVRPPAPSRLRTLGWTLVAISVLTTAIVVTTAF
jgi:hypothetical protein